jgi:hypothetical protein
VSAKQQLLHWVDSLDENEAADLLKMLTLRAEIDKADRQLENGEFTDYNEDTIHESAEAVKRRGKERLAAERKIDKS